MATAIGSRRAPAYICVLILALASAPGAALAQLGTGTILGTVTDETGAVVPGVNISITNVATGLKRETITNEQGNYKVPGLLPGTYQVSASLPGFKTYKRSGIVLQVDQEARIDILMQVGEVSETVEVVGAAPMLNTESATIGEVVDERKIVDLPLNGRNFVQLALILPGVNEGQPGNAQNGGTGDNPRRTGSGISVSGARQDQNNYLLDGTENTDQFLNTLLIRPSIDAIQEFKIQRSTYSAEFGKAPGGQINVVTKSGTNEFHGALYEFHRNDAVQARNLFDLNPLFMRNGKFVAPPFKQNQFGGTFGGPIKRDRTFFFGNYEGFRQVRGLTRLLTVPTPAQRRGDFSSQLGPQVGTDALGRPVFRNQLFDPLTTRTVTLPDGRRATVRDPFPGNVIPLDRFDPVSRRILDHPGIAPPLPNVPGEIDRATGNPRNNLIDSTSLVQSWDTYMFRVDHQIATNSSLLARYSLANEFDLSPVGLPGHERKALSRAQNLTISHTHSFTPTMINEFRFGFNKLRIRSAPINWFNRRDVTSELGIRGLPFAKNEPGAPEVSITGFTTLGDFSGSSPLLQKDATFHYLEHLSFNRGRHFFKVGLEARRVQLNTVRAQTMRGSFAFDTQLWTADPTPANRSVTGSQFANFLLGLSRQKGRRISDFNNHERATEWGFFFQDDFKVTQKLTLNYGIRYMLYVPPKDIRDRLATFDVNCPGCFPNDYRLGGPRMTPPELGLGGIVPLANLPRFVVAGREVPRSLIRTDKNDWGPRFGFAWRPSQRTVIRAGYGIFYNTMSALETEDAIENIPTVFEDQQSLTGFALGSPLDPSCRGECFFGFRDEIPIIGIFSPGPNVLDTDVRNAYLQHWTLSLQRELTSNLVFEIDYVGNKGTKLTMRENVNTAEPGLPVAAIPPGSVPDPRLRRLMPFGVFRMDPQEAAKLPPEVFRDPRTGDVLIPLDNVFRTASVGFSTYHAMQMRMEWRYSKNLSFIGAYTVSKAFGFQPFAGGANDTGNRIQNVLRRQDEKGLAPYDARQRFTFSFLYDLPVGPGKRFLSQVNPVVGKIIGGWQVNGIIVEQSGFPLSINRQGDPLGTFTDGSLRPDLVGKTSLPRRERKLSRYFNTEAFQLPPPDRLYGTAGRSTVIMPGTNVFDLALFKNTRIKENVNIQFRAEFFNAFNHPNWGQPGRFFGTAQFGVISSARDPRIIQFALKIIY